MSSRTFVAAALALGLAACNGSQSTVPSTGANAPNASAPAAREKASLEVRLKIPKRAKHARYISPSTQSISIRQGKTKLGTFNTAASGSCVVQNGGTVCRFKLGIRTGKKQLFTIDSFDGVNGTGKLLSAGTVVKTIEPGLNLLTLTLSGVVASLSIDLQDPFSPAGTPATLAIHVSAQDPDGNTIVGPGNYNTPVALADSDATHVTALSASTVSGPGDVVALSYTGANISSATITASATGVTASTATFEPTPANAGSFPLPTAIGTHTGLSLTSVAIAKGADGNLWVSAGNSTYDAILRMTTSGTFTTFAPGVAPSTNLPNDEFNGLAAGSDGNIWYAGTANVGFIVPATGAVTNVPLSGITGICAGAAGKRVVPAADGGLWFTILCTSGSQLLHATTGTVPAFVANTLPSTFGSPQGLVVATDGRVYIAGSDTTGTATAAILQAAVSGATVGSTAVADIANDGQSAQGIAQTADGDLWLTNGTCNPSMLVRMHLAGGFSAASATGFPTLIGCAQAAFPLALSDGDLWVPLWDYANVLEVTPAAYPAAPAQFNLMVTTPPPVNGYMWDAALGPDGFLYFTNNSSSSTGTPISANVAKVAY